MRFIPSIRSLLFALVVLAISAASSGRKPLKQGFRVTQMAIAIRVCCSEPTLHSISPPKGRIYQWLAQSRDGVPPTGVKCTGTI
jgi:hypothetical protein